MTDSPKEKSLGCLVCALALVPLAVLRGWEVSWCRPAWEGWNLAVYLHRPDRGFWKNNPGLREEIVKRINAYHLEGVS